MTLKTRRILFYSLTFLFLLTAAGVILYSTGLRFDFRNRIITETGGIYIKSEPTDVFITLNGEPLESDTGILRTGTLFDNLSPGNYVITVRKEDYYGWQKNVAVDARSVAIFDSIILVREKGAVKVGEPVDGFYLRDGQFIVRRAGTIRFDGVKIIGETVTNFTRGGAVISYAGASQNYYLSDIANLDSSLNLNLIFNNLKETRLGLPGPVPIIKIEPYPFDDRRFVVMTGRALYIMDTDALAIEQIDPRANDFVIEGSVVFWINENGISSYHLVFGTHSSVSSSETISTDDVKKIGVNSGTDRIALLKNSGQLIILENNSGTATTVSSNASSFSFSNDGKTLVIIDNGRTIRAYSLYEEDEEKQRAVTLTTLPGTLVSQLVWHGDNKHIFVKDSANNLRFLEIDDNLPINEVLISRRVGDFVYDAGEKSLYFNNPSGIWQLGI